MFFNGAEQPHYFCKGQNGIEIMCVLFPLCAYSSKKGGLIKEKDSEREWADEYNWPLCTNGESHNIRRLLLAQIIPKNELLDLADKLHKLRLHLNLNQFCHPQKNEDFTDAYSLQRLASDKKSRVCNCFFS